MSKQTKIPGEIIAKIRKRESIAAKRSCERQLGAIQAEINRRHVEMYAQQALAMSEGPGPAGFMAQCSEAQKKSWIERLFLGGAR